MCAACRSFLSTFPLSQAFSFIIVFKLQDHTLPSGVWALFTFTASRGLPLILLLWLQIFPGHLRSVVWTPGVIFYSFSLSVFNPPFQMPVGAAPHATFLYRWLHLGPVSQYLSASFSTFSHTLFVLTKVVVTTENLKISDHLTFHRFIRVWCGVFS